MNPVDVAWLADRLAGAVGPGAVSVSLEDRWAASTDHAWLSPVLADRLPERPADVVVTPEGVGGVAAVARVAAATGVPVTPRGRGTGNYGQAVPLAGGIVLEMTRCDRVLEVGDGWLRAEPGASFTRLEAVARASGQELAMFPSTVGSSIGGFVAGGAGGTGSIENGLLWDGFVLAATVVGCTEDAEPAGVEGAGVGPYLHAYGTTGLLVDVTARLVPARRWVALWASFASWEAAAAAGSSLMHGCDPAPRSVSVDDPDLAPLVTADPAAPVGRTSLRAIVEEGSVGAASAIVVGQDGRVEAVRHRGASALTGLSFNHVTLRAKRARPALCHVQVGGPLLAAAHDDLVACLPGGGLHLDGMRREGAAGWGGLLLGTFPGPDALDDAIDALRALGVEVTDPHTWKLGGHGLAGLVAAAERNDPYGLLNPGKLPGRRPVRAVNGRGTGSG